MTTSLDEIVARLNQRREARSPIIARMEQIRQVYNGDIVVPLPEMDRQERVAVANLAQVGLDQKAMRVSSVLPDCSYPPTKPGIKKEEQRAADKRRANLGWWKMNSFKRLMRQRARFLIGYACAPVVIRYDAKLQIPKWQLRSPLTAFPPPGGDLPEIHPDDCIFTFNQTYGWLQQNYPDQIGRLNTGQKPKRDDLYELVEYLDAEECVLGVLGRKKTDDQVFGGEEKVELERVENRTGYAPTVIPGRITLDREQGEFDGIIGMYQTQAKLMALELIAVEKGVFPDTYLVSRPNEVAKYISGPHDSRSGEVNIVAGGDIKTMVDNPGYQTQPTINMMERYSRLTAGIPAEFGGESPSNVRTGRRGDSILSAVVDFPVQEAQDIFAECIEIEDRIAISQVKNYSGSQPRPFYISWRGLKGGDTFIPKETFDTDEHYVAYSHPGTDANSLPIGGGQRVGMGTLSKYGFMVIDPLVQDPEFERDQIIKEGIEQAILSGLQAQASQPGSDIAAYARIMQLVQSDQAELAEAILKVQKEKQEAQAPAVEPVAPGSPEAQPGLAAPGQGAEAGVAVGPPPDAATNIAQLFGALRRPSMTVPGEIPA